MLFFTRLCSETKHAGLLLGSLSLLIMLTGCDRQTEQERQMLQEQIGMLQNQVKGWQAHYHRLLCLQDALNAMENLDMALSFALTLTVYKQKIETADLALAPLECPEGDKQSLMDIMACHHLAARIWETRNQDLAGAVTEDFIRQVYPLWIKFDHPWPPFVTPGLRQLMADYGEASGPEARRTLQRITGLWQNPSTMPTLASIANQLLWHEAHNLLRDYKLQLLTPPYPTQ